MRSGGSGGGGGGLGAEYGGGGGEGIAGGGDGFGERQPPGGAGGGGSVQFTGGVVVFFQHHCAVERGRGSVSESAETCINIRLRGECTHDVAVSEVRRVGVVRHRRGGRIQPIGRSAGGVRLGDVRGVGHPWRDPSRVSRSAARALYSRLNDHEAPCVMSPSFSSPGLQRREGLPLRWTPEIAWEENGSQHHRDRPQKTIRTVADFQQEPNSEAPKR